MRINAKEIRKALELSEAGISQRVIAVNLQVGKTTVQRVLSRAANQDITSIKAHNMDDKELMNAIFPSTGVVVRHKTLPDFKKIHDRISHTSHRSVMHEWIDYKSADPDGYEYSRFAKLYRDWCSEFKVHPKLLTNEVPGQCMYLDWAGDTISCHFDGDSQSTPIYFFVTSIGASELPYVEPFESMDALQYATAEIHALDFYGGIPKYVVPDNTKAAVIKNRDKEFELQQLFEELEDYYGYTVLPARPRKPTDKNDVEANVHHSEDYIISDMKLHEAEYKSMAEVKSVCKFKLNKMIRQKFRGTNFSRLDWFTKVDLPELRPLKKDFVLYRHEYAKVPSNYHVHIKHDPQQYSVPYQYIGHDVILKYSDTDLIVEDKETGEIIAQWKRVYNGGLHTVNTMPSHRPPNHQIAAALRIKDAQWYREQAGRIGPNTLRVINMMLENHQNHPEEIYRACMGVISQAWSGNKNKCTYAELEEACLAAIKMNSVHYGTIRHYLESKREEKKANSTIQRKHLPEHSNIRDKSIYK